MNQMYDPERILHPLRRVGERGVPASGNRCPGKKRSKILRAVSVVPIQEGRNNEIMYHVGRPGEDGYIDRILSAHGMSTAHNSHTNICSAGARTGYADVDGLRPPFSRFRQREIHSSPVGTTREPATTSTRTPSASSRRRQAGAKAGDRRSEAIEHGIDVRLLALGMAGNRSRHAVWRLPDSCSWSGIRHRP